MLVQSALLVAMRCCELSSMEGRVVTVHSPKAKIPLPNSLPFIFTTVATLSVPDSTRWNQRSSTTGNSKKRVSRQLNPDVSRLQPGGRTKRISKLNSEVSPHRAVAAVRLLRTEKGNAFVDLLNDTRNESSGENEMAYVERTLSFRTRHLEDKDIRLATGIVAGAVRWRRYLDHLILSLCSEEKLFREMEPLLLQILRISFYEIVKLDNPVHAVVDENVRLAKAALRPGAGNMVNAILRKLIGLKETSNLPHPKVEGDARNQARALAIIYSHPVWMVRRWIRFLGQEEAVRLMKWNNTDPSFCLRVNASKGYTRASLTGQLENLKVPYELSVVDDFVRIQGGMQAVLRAGLMKEGICAVQDESAGLVVSVVDPQRGETIIDCCAAPGGKALFMASRLSGRGMIFAVDINKGRLRILKEAAAFQNVDDVVTAVHADIRTYAGRNIRRFDKVLLDSPCSGLGVLSKRADLRWNRQLEDLEQLIQLQDELLDAASLLVKPGGILVYSTCSIDPEENEERIGGFLGRHKEFVLQRVDGYVPPELITDEGFFSSSPTKHCMDGAFAARLVRSLD